MIAYGAPFPDDYDDRLPRWFRLFARLGATFTPAELVALQIMRNRWSGNGELFSEQERARLSFLAWLVATGRLIP